MQMSGSQGKNHYTLLEWRRQLVSAGNVNGTVQIKNTLAFHKISRLCSVFLKNIMDCFY